MTQVTSDIVYRHADADLFAIEAGQGTPIVLLHGGLGTHRAALLFGAPLAARHRLILPDLRASGRSHHHGPLSWDHFADDLAALLGHLELPRAVIGGVSFGSACAVRFALRHPDMTAALVLLTPVFAGADRGLATAPRAAMEAMQAAGRRALVEGVRALHPLLAALPEDMQARARELFDTYDIASVAALTAFMASGAEPFDTAAELAAIEAPTLIVPGVDPTHPAEVADLYHRYIRRSVLRAATPEAYASVIADFLAAIAEYLDRAR